MKALKKLVSISAAFAMLTGGSLGNMPGEITSEYLYSVSAAEATSGECGKQGDNLTWTLDEAGTLTISGTGEMADWGYSTRSPWYDNSDIKQVIINEGVTSIGDHPFDFCEKITSITIPNSVTRIGAALCYSFSALDSVTIPAGVTSISEYAFMSDSLSEINVDEGNINYSSIDGVLFDKDQTILIQYPASSKVETYEIPEGVTSIEQSAFSPSWGLTSVTIPDSVTSIFSSAFAGNYDLEYFNVAPENPNYSSIDGVLFNKDQTTLVKYPPGNSSETYVVPDGVSIISSWAFYHSHYLISLTIPESVTEINYESFDDCDKLTDLYFLTPYFKNEYTIDNTATIHSYDHSSAYAYAKKITGNLYRLASMKELSLHPANAVQMATISHGR